ncbi:unnamed protein product [Linum tenue]|uniref:Uncharacterized protein n=1 Tax=Linum tenue TaxID=586396 RepID=A0AAV0S128_9ROSI|nr:unnamed protein product [Linum tenue]CAI0626526.1 unnamed protein product [Linum tenue]
MTKSRDLQTPLKELSRASETANRRSKESQSKKPQKIAKRSLTGEFTTISEDASCEIAGDGSGVSEILDADHSNELVKNSSMLSPALSATSKIAPPSSDTPLTSKANKVSDNGANKLADRPAEAAIIIGLLRKVQSEAPKSVDANNGYKKILEELIKVVVHEYCALPEERDWLTKLLSWKRGVVFLSLLIWSFVVCILVFFNAGYGGGSVSGIAPT